MSQNVFLNRHQFGVLLKVDSFNLALEKFRKLFQNYSFYK